MIVLYKICTAAQWRVAERDGVFRGSDVDRHDGFIHFSTAAQVVETTAKPDKTICCWRASIPPSWATA